MTYRQSSSNTTLYPITTMITGCNAEYCSLDVFRRLAHGSRPDLPMEQVGYKRNVCSTVDKLTKPVLLVVRRRSTEIEFS